MADSSQPTANTSAQPYANGNAHQTETSNVQDGPTTWRSVYDAVSGRYYYYNLETRETTWKNPLAPDTSDEPVLQAHFNPRTGQFESADRIQHQLYASAVDERHMGQYFDYGTWMSQQQDGALEGEVQGEEEKTKRRRVSRREMRAIMKRKEARKKIKQRWLFEDD